MKTTIINKILLVLMLITAQQVSALEFQVDGIYYRTSIFTKNSAYVTHSGTSYTESVEYQGEVVIPESVTYNGKTYTIASIGGYAFAGCPGLTSVTIPSTVTTINQNAFNGCTGLKTIECKATTPPALGDNAFTSYDATLVVPSSSESAYKSAAGWSNFKFKEEPSETPGSGENSGEDSGSDNSGSDNTYGLACKILNSTDVAIIAGTEKYTGDIVIPSQVTISGKTYTVTSIANDAFKGCTGLTSITIPSSITSIGSSSFDSCNNLNKVNISDILSWCKITFANSLANPLYYAKKLYLNGTLVTKLEIPSAITEIKNYTFYNCTSISTIVFPSGILKIGNSAFVNCSNMTSVTIPNSVTTIDENAFNGCTGLTSLTIGSSVGSIGNYAFGNCTGLKSVTSLNSTPPTCGTGVFQGVTISSIPLTVPAGSESLYKATYTWQDFKYKEESENPGDDPAVDTSGLKYNIISSTDVEVVGGTEKYTGDIVIPSQTTIDGKTYNVTKIGIQAFNGCAGLTSITIPNSVYIIADESIYDCSALKSITIPSSVTSIGNYVLSMCPSLTSIVVESGNVKYDSRNNCNAIIETSTNTLIAGCKKTVIPSSVSIIGTAAFYGCTGLTSITIPSSVVSLGEGAFFDCTGLTSISIPNSVTSIGENVFAYCENLKTVTLSNKIKTISFSAFSGCYSLTGIEIPNSVTTIDEEAFSYCESITNITIGENVNSIGKCAFMSCNGLSRISTLNPTPPTCGENVFKNVNVSNVTLTVPTGSVSIYKSADIWKDFKYEQTEEPSEPELPTDNSGLSYNILNSTEVEVIAGAEKYTGDIVIPSQTTIDGKVYNVTKVGFAAFHECTGLTNITIPNSVTSIGTLAFSNCSGLTRVISLSTTPPTCGTDVFYNVSVGNITLEVPAESVSMYQSADIWKDFGTIKGIGESSALTYNILNETDVEVIAGTEKYTGDIVIPSQTTIDGKVYNVTKVGEKAFYGCDGLTSITIPNSVTSISNYAYFCCTGLTSVTIPNSVTSIGNYAFSGCNGLTIITISNSVTSIGDNAFGYCSGLTSVTIPNSVTFIGAAAFRGCSGLTSITISERVTIIGESAFSDCSGLESIYVESENTVYDSRDNCNAIIEKSTNKLITGCKNSVIPNSVTSIGSWAFSGCSGLTRITIPNSVTSIGSRAFYGCSGLTSITIPNSVTSIGDFAFTFCSGLTSVIIGSSVTSIDNFAFYYCSGLSSVISLSTTPPMCGGTDVFGYVSVENITLEVPSVSVSLYQSADIWKRFGTIKGISEEDPEFPTDNSGLSYNILNETDVEVVAGTEKYTGDIVIPSQTTIDGKVYNVTKVGYNAFYECTGLTSIIIPNSVTYIEIHAFSGCSGLISITIPNSVNNIGNSAFRGCIGLTSVTIPNSVTNIDNYAFDGCSGLTSITIGNCVTSIGISAFRNCSGLISVTIPNSVTSIGDVAFYGCSGLTSVTIPDGVTSIGERAFYGCSGLTSVTIPDGVTSIGEAAFANCSGLTSVTIPDGVTSIGEAAFAYCSGLTSIVVESGNTVYDSRDNCNAIIETSTNTLITGCKNTVIPNSVASIGNCAFSGCSGLTSVTIPNSVTSIGNSAFSGCSGLTSVTIPDGVTSIGDYAFLDCDGLTSITIPNSVITIGKQAFRLCTSLTKITIPNSVTTIGEAAFTNCSGLTSVTIPNSVTSIGEMAFSSCNGLTSIVVESGNTVYDSRDNCNAIIETSTNTLITGCKNTVIPNSVTSIGNYAFYYCSGLTSITIPNSVNNIGNSAFYYCNRLTSVTSLSTTPPTCGTSVFNNVSVGNITLEVPAESVSLYQIADTWKDFGTIKGIGESSALTYNILNETDVEVVAGTEKYTGDIVIPSQTTIDGKVYNVTSIGNTAFDGCTGLTSVTIPNSVTSIGDLAFNCCSGLTSITIPSSVTSIGDYAFSQCTGLTSVTIPSSVISLGRAPFSDCYFINSFVVESGNTKYDSRENCNAIIETSTNSLIQGCENTVIPNSVTGIGEEAFAGCNSLTSITIPNSVTSIGNSAFSFCSLTSIIIPSSVTSIAGGIFYYCYGLTSIIVASGNTIYDSRDNCNAIIETSTNKLITGCENTVIPNSVTGIGDNAFSGCSGLTSISIPSSVTSIGNYAFYCCNRLTSVTSLSTTPPTCGTSVFGNVSVGNITLEVPSESVSLYQSADTWKDLGTITAVSSASRSESSGIDDILADDDEVEYYNLQGVRVMNPEKGIYIKRQGGKTSKVVL